MYDWQKCGHDFKIETIDGRLCAKCRVSKTCVDLFEEETKKALLRQGEAQLATDDRFLNPVIFEVIDERERQDEKWGEQNHDPFKYLAILGEEVGEANNAVLEAFDFKCDQFDVTRLNAYREELIQVAAVAVAMVESFDRGKWREHVKLKVHPTHPGTVI